VSQISIRPAWFFHACCGQLFLESLFAPSRDNFAAMSISSLVELLSSTNSILVEQALQELADAAASGAMPMKIFAISLRVNIRCRQCAHLALRRNWGCVVEAVFGFCYFSASQLAWPTSRANSSACLLACLKPQRSRFVIPFVVHPLSQHLTSANFFALLRG
jgi:hypothetical protein